MLASEATKQASLAEEMRKLYVALTRAEQRLIIVGTVKDREKAVANWEKACQSDRLVLDMNDRLNTNNALDWIGMCLVRHPRFAESLRSRQVDPHFIDLNGDETQFQIEFVTVTDLQKIGQQTTPMTGAEWLKTLHNKLGDADYSEVNVSDIDRVMNFSYPNLQATQTTAYQSVSEVKRLFNDPDTIEMGDFSINQNETGAANRFVAKDFDQPRFLQTKQAPAATEIGTATHLLMQEIDLTQPITAARIAARVQELVMGNVLTEEVAAKIDQASVLNFFENSELGQLLVAHPAQVKREQPFSLLLSAQKLFGEIDDEEAKVLIHGIMDGYVVLPERVILYDFKTDYVAFNDKAASIEKIKERYRGQVNLYAEALADILDRPVTDKYLYLLASGDLVTIEGE
ncbi:PD-(D/E)XK nuclease family protein [Secundilactobacillus oryzae]|nr:PD-(D/E)XK nuclease family protein [Secundilactobacillus oryzae]